MQNEIYLMNDKQNKVQPCETKTRTYCEGKEYNTKTMDRKKYRAIDQHKFVTRLTVQFY